MSFTVNGIEIPLSPEENRQQLLLKVSLSLNTLPKYIYNFPETITEGDEFDILNLLDRIKNSSKRATDFSSFIDLEDIKKAVDNLGLDVKTDVLYPWLSYNEKIPQVYAMNSQILDTVGEKLVAKKYFSTVQEFKNFWSMRDSIKSNLENEIENLQFMEERYTQSQVVLEEYKGKYYSDFMLEKIVLKTIINLENVSLLEIFNRIVLNKNIPFACCQNYYKILNNYLPPPLWNVSLDEQITLKLLNKDNYIDVYIGIENEKVYGLIELKVGFGNISQKEVLKQIDIVLGGNLTFTEPEQLKVIGKFYFPNVYINTYVLSDLIMNNTVFSTFLNTLEFDKVSKKLDKTGQTWLSIYYNEGDKFVSATIARKTIDRRDPYIRTTDEKTFTHGEPAVKVHAKGENIEIIKRFQEKLAVLLEYYENEERDIIDFYKEFIPNFGQYEIEKIPEMRKREYEDKDLFVANYSRSCPNPPVSISREQAEEYMRNETREVLKFPRDILSEGVVYPSDGKNQNYYICSDSKIKYPGIKVNTRLSNKAEYPFIPCCYPNQQSGFVEKKGKSKARSENYQEYYFGIKKEKSEAVKQQKIVITRKILASDKSGKLPDVLENLFFIINDDPQYEFIRLGVDRNKSSFLNCVLTALGELDIIGEENRIQKLKEQRILLSKKAMLAKQCDYISSIEKCKENILNMDFYLDPKLYIQLLEEQYKCNIFLFGPEEMLLPHFMEGLYKYKNNRPTVLVYEHLGSEADAALYPQCELIVKWDPKVEDSLQYNFVHDEIITKNVLMVYNKVNESYVNGNLLSYTSPKLRKNIVSQVLDEYGKCRCINLEFDDFSFSLFVSPMPPMPVKAVKKEDIIYVENRNIDRVVDILTELGFSMNGKKGKIGNIEVQVKTTDENMLREASKINVFNTNKKIARYLIHYTFYNFSKYAIDKPIDTALNDFKNDGFVIERKHEYKIVPKQFGLQNDISINDKIVVTSVEMKNRLLYSLYLAVNQKENEIKNYHKLINMPDYYEDITDFDTIDTQILLYGESSIQKWIDSNHKKFIQSTILPSSKIPYYFKNKLVYDKLFLAQNTDSLEKALDIAYNWIKNRVNINDSAINFTADIQFTFHSFANTNDIKTFKVVGREIEKEINIIGYKVNNVSQFTVLLDL